MFFLAKTFSVYSIPYFIVLVFVGNFFLINLTLAVIKLKFTESQESKPIEDDLCKKKKTKI